MTSKALPPNESAPRGVCSQGISRSVRHELGLSRVELDGVRLVASLAGLREEVTGARADLQEAPLRRELA